MKLQEILQKEGMCVQKILVPANNGLTEMAPNMLETLGLEKKVDDYYVDKNFGVEVIRYRGEDIPQQCEFFTSRGIPVLGITGEDFLYEYKLKMPASKLRQVSTVSSKLKPTLCLISIEGRRLDDFPDDPTIVINRKYEATSRQYIQQLERRYGVQFGEIRVLNGKTENEIPQRADYGIEIVVSGDTLKYTNNATKTPRIPQLCILERIRQSYINVITSFKST